MRTLKLLAIGFLIASNAYAGTGKVDQIFSGSTVNGTGNTVVGRAINVSSADKIGFWFQSTKGASVGSTIAHDIVMQSSYSDTSSTFATAQTIRASSSVNTPTTVALTHPNMKFVRFFVQGGTGNATDTTITAYMFTQD
jgi:hypothetical protein